MIFTMSSGMPFQPDAASDWWNFAVNILVAAGTIAAVWVAVATARKSNRLAEAAHISQVAAAAASLAVTERAIEIERDLEAERRSYNRRIDTERRANRQAVDIKVMQGWLPLEDGTEMTADSHGNIAAFVYNQSATGIVEVEVEFHRERGLEDTFRSGTGPQNPVMLSATQRHVTGGNSLEFTNQQPVYVWGHTYGDRLHFTVRFTDQYRDRWQLENDGSLLLLNPRLIDVYPAGDPT